MGKGAFGEVSLYASRTSNTLFAIKKIALMDDNSRRLAICRELENHQVLNNDHVVKFVTSFMTRDHIFVVMEKMEISLQKELLRRSSSKKRGKFEEPEAGVIVKDLLEAIKYCHSKNITHRDISPANILLKQGRGKLSDFGLSTNLPGQTRCGDLNYIAPEVLKGKVYGPSVDIWSIGIIAYEVCDGTVPSSFVCNDEAGKGKEENGLRFPPTFSFELKAFLSSLVVKGPKQRPKAHEALQSLWMSPEVSKRGTPWRDCECSISFNYFSFLHLIIFFFCIYFLFSIFKLNKIVL